MTADLVNADLATATPALPVAQTRIELATARAGLASPVGVVMTMGALHDGHAALIRAARADNASVLVTIFVNPLQFGPNEDFERYPRSLAADLELCRAEGADLVFAPDLETMYPTREPLVRVDPGPLGSRLEGASRPGHFAGVLTVVAKLLHLTRPDRAYFGEKDFQQLALIRRMVADLDFPVEIVGVATIREPDGLARSSRNRYLTDELRPSALALSRALAAGRDAAPHGPRAVLAAARHVLETTPGVRLDRLDLVDPATLAPPTGPGVARLLVAAFLDAATGPVRLIDNCPVDLP